jgi:hypothetical protein
MIGSLMYLYLGQCGVLLRGLLRSLVVVCFSPYIMCSRSNHALRKALSSLFCPIFLKFVVIFLQTRVFCGEKGESGKNK